MATFYTGVDKSIYQGGDHYVPMEKFRLNPYEQKNLSYESSQPQSYGITNTNAFTNSGGGMGGNAFGYGSAIKPGDPSVLTSGPYAGQSGYYGSLNYEGGLPGDIAQKGPGRHFEYEFTKLNEDGDLVNAVTGKPATNKFYRDYSLTPKKEVPGWTRAAAGFIPFGNTALNFIENRMNPTGPMTLDDVNRGTYAIAGLSDLDKKAYNELAGSGMLFAGPSGLKTLTGKNFGAKGYFEGQAEIYDEKGFDKFTEDEEGEVYDASGNKVTGFLKKQYLEASKMFDFKQQKLEQQRQDFLKSDTRNDPITGTKAIQKRIDAEYEAQKERDGRDFTVSGPDTTANPTGKSNQQSAERGYSLHGADGGRAIFKYGGLASIL